MPAAAATPTLAVFSATLDQQWDYAKPAESEQRFRAELAQWPAGRPAGADRRHPDRAHAGSAPPVRRSARDARRGGRAARRRARRSCACATCSSGAARSIRQARRSARCRCSSRRSRSPNAATTRSTPSTRRTCSASRRRLPERLELEPQSGGDDRAQHRRPHPALARLAVQQHRPDVPRTGRLRAGARLLQEGAAGLGGPRRRRRCPRREVDDRARAAFARPPRRRRNRSSGRCSPNTTGSARPTATSTRSWPRSRWRAATPPARSRGRPRRTRR